MTRSRGLSWMSKLLILRYRLKEVTNSYVLHCLWSSKNYSYLCNQMPNWDRIFGSKCKILNGQVIYIEKSKLDIADMWLIPLITSQMCRKYLTLKWTVFILFVGTNHKFAPSDNQRWKLQILCQYIFTFIIDISLVLAFFAWFMHFLGCILQN